MRIVAFVTGLFNKKNIAYITRVQNVLPLTNLPGDRNGVSISMAFALSSTF